AGVEVATAESCTGGWIAKCLTDASGSSGWFSTGVVSYGNATKAALLGVDALLIEQHGAVSRPVVEAMAVGLRERWAPKASTVAVSGVAGPTGGSAEKPVGLVWFGWADAKGGLRSEHRVFPGDREAVRRHAVARALVGLRDGISG
ncbi:MAG: nicotinamide-nucleotide amidohydrolase family protein, partial [Pseudomonadota bacterium]